MNGTKGSNRFATAAARLVVVAAAACLAWAAAGCDRAPKKTYSSASVPADYTPYVGAGYSLKLPPGWVSRPGVGGGVNFYPPDAAPPFQDNVFLKVDPNVGSAPPSAGIDTLRREMTQYMSDSKVFEEMPVSVNGNTAYQARFSGNLKFPGAPPAPLAGIMVVVKSGSKGYGILYTGKAADYDRHAPALSNIVASFVPQ